ncbi:uncharacterized protein LOC126924752 isoform X2 [Bombus affinis]|uniref:uncharacterized protein LOC126924752 isoform X2 n=1 Tax=Bombus affinis TaxID=309941 RepID=UPI0021B81A35|nr:uncharacterized protein LOC126924752 isoform X2 [Bombus affinis]
MNHSKIVIPIKYLYYEISNLKVMEVKIVQSLGYGRLWKTTYLWTIMVISNLKITREVLLNGTKAVLSKREGYRNGLSNSFVVKRMKSFGKIFLTLLWNTWSVPMRFCSERYTFDHCSAQPLLPWTDFVLQSIPVMMIQWTRGRPYVRKQVESAV